MVTTIIHRLQFVMLLIAPVFIFFKGLIFLVSKPIACTYPFFIFFLFRLATSFLHVPFAECHRNFTNPTESVYTNLSTFCLALSWIAPFLLIPSCPLLLLAICCFLHLFCTLFTVMWSSQQPTFLRCCLFHSLYPQFSFFWPSLPLIYSRLMIILSSR